MLCISYLHGEKVAIGTLASLFLTDKSASMIDTVYGFCEEVGLPTTLDEIGLKGVTDEELKLVAEKAFDKSSRIHYEPHRISVDAIVNALKVADAYGKSRKCKK